jgi:hypothetical protein
MPWPGAGVHRVRRRQHAELIVRGPAARRRYSQVLAAEHHQVALHDDAPARIDHQLTDVDHVEQVVAAVEAELLGRHGEVPDLARGHLPVQHAQLPGGEREMPGQPGPVGVVRGPVGEHVGLTPVVHPLAEAAPDGDGGVEEDRLPGPALGQAGAAELA